MPERRLTYYVHDEDFREQTFSTQLRRSRYLQMALSTVTTRSENDLATLSRCEPVIYHSHLSLHRCR